MADGGESSEGGGTPVKFTQLFIDNQFIDAVEGATFDTVDPRSGEPICAVAEGRAEDVGLAVVAAFNTLDILTIT